MIHIMGDLRETTAEIERREHELREKQEQLIQAGKLATLGELTTGIAHELNNPLNNIGLFVGNSIDRIELGKVDLEVVRDELGKAMEQVRKATEIISHLRTFGRAATIVYEPVEIGLVIERSLSLMQEQLRLRQIEVAVEPGAEPIVVHGNEIQLEQVFVNLLTNARDALADAGAEADLDHVRGAAARGRRHVRRQRAGRSRRTGSAHLRPVLHHQGGRCRHGPRPLDHLRDRQRARRDDRGRQPAAGGGAQFTIELPLADAEAEA